MNKYIGLVLITLLVALSIAFFVNRKKTDYDFANPDDIIQLPHVLKEISGITVTKDNQIACVQDEIGTVFIYDIETDKLVNEYQNSMKGDFEGIALVNTSMYVLRSDGVLVEYGNYTSPVSITKEYNLNLPSENNEGLCYDKKNNRLLIAAKSKPEDGEKKSIRLIYGFDLKTKQCDAEPIFKLHIKHIEEKAAELNIIQDKDKKEKKKKNKEKDDEKDNVSDKESDKENDKENDTDKKGGFNFRPSEIAVNPVDSSIYILSGKDKLLLVTSPKGKIKNLIALDPMLFRQAEGMTFLSNGDLLISNEANKGKPTLLLFKNKK